MQSKFALRVRKINNLIESWCLVASGGVEICVSSSSFQKNDVGWPQNDRKDTKIQCDSS